MENSCRERCKDQLAPCTVTNRGTDAITRVQLHTTDKYSFVYHTSIFAETNVYRYNRAHETGTVAHTSKYSRIYERVHVQSRTRVSTVAYTSEYMYNRPHKINTVTHTSNYSRTYERVQVQSRTGEKIHQIHSKQKYIYQFMHEYS
jgi:hypothetical protein